MLRLLIALCCWLLSFRLIFLIVAFCKLLLYSGNVYGQWWVSTTVYHIYPRSFFDTNGDGIGDINGIIQKLDYIQQLGFETIWVSPFFKSPQQDFGYDISDYYNIAPEYGDMATCERLIDEVHRRGMKIIFDMVMNHTSTAHEWFQLSASSKDNPKSDWYVWRDGRGKNANKPPNNWKAMIGGSGWHWHEGRKQFYWTSFLPFQPDLNYHNPEVKQAMLGVVKYWLEKGVDGFRLDIFNAIYEDHTFRNNPIGLRLIPSEENPDGFFQKMRYNINHEQSFEFATELRKVVDSFPDRYLVGEVTGDINTLKKFCMYQDKKGLHTVFLFKTLTTPLRARAYRKMVEGFELHFQKPLVPVYVYSNHDRKRSISRLGNNIDKAKLLAMFQFTVRGVPYTYYGEELGMPQSKLPFKNSQDPIAHRYRPFHQWLARLWGESLNRDECRTPMLWNDDMNAGFTASTHPWLPVSSQYQSINVARQLADEHSLLNFYRKIIGLRRQITALQHGSLRIAREYCSRSVLAYYRFTDHETYLILLNLSNRKIKCLYPKGELIASTRVQAAADYLSAYEGRILKLKP